MTYHFDMKASDLININDKVRQLIKAHLQANNMTLTAFAKATGIHQAQLWVYMNEKQKGLHTSTLEKIGDYLAKKV